MSFSVVTTPLPAAQPGELGPVFVAPDSLHPAIPVIAETTATYGLVVAPYVGHDDHGRARFLGGFTVYHRRSGRPVFGKQLAADERRSTLAYARAAAAALAGPDWDAEWSTLAADPDVRDRAKDVMCAAPPDEQPW